MSDARNEDRGPSRRTVLLSAAAASLAPALLPGLGSPTAQAATLRAPPSPAQAPAAPPPGYNILFILVDQEHFMESWPFPVPGREHVKKRGTTFTNYQLASCVCSSARSVLYTGQHIQQTGVFDNLDAPWQRNMSTEVTTIGKRLQQLGYHAAYQGKWHLSFNLDRAHQPVDVPLADYSSTIKSYGFEDYVGLGDLVDGGHGGYIYDGVTTAVTSAWLRTKGQQLAARRTPWFLAVNLVNPHDVMYFDSDQPGQKVQSAKSAMPIAPAPDDELYRAEWNVPLPATRNQALDAPGRPRAHRMYQETQNILLGEWPNEDRRWKALQDYHYNCIRDSDAHIVRILEDLAATGLDRNTIVVVTADHGELAGAHQMRGKGATAYKEQNHLPLMILHPAYPGERTCRAVTSQVDIAPTLIGLTGVASEAAGRAAAGLKGRDMSRLLAAPEKADLDTLRPAALFNFNMFSYLDAPWAARILPVILSPTTPPQEKAAALMSSQPDFGNRGAVRSIFDGRYRFSRYFAPLRHNRPTTLEALLRDNDLEVFDLHNDPDEVRNLAMDVRANGELILALNAKLNARIDEEVGEDDGRSLPLKDGRWFFPPPGSR
ncbi:arylsulfatase A-like enzyme [Stella humosa]|uniref:Arylsulfatase A-like enzyme n=1 Tax=Stella humosa TaxID=94 RepID=A0A3N1MEE4_9PROT|nr:sulfatase-like hydrolase/transferase [Stella humosa]ROQ01067.1 arylsulfatase A-like enzyme [Stella humosa]